MIGKKRFSYSVYFYRLFRVYLQLADSATNSCDGSFAHWKQKLKIQRGLRKHRQRQEAFAISTCPQHTFYSASVLSTPLFRPFQKNTEKNSEADDNTDNHDNSAPKRARNGSPGPSSSSS